MRALALVVLIACGGAVASPPCDSDAQVADASVEADVKPPPPPVCSFTDDAGNTYELVCGNWASWDTADVTMLDSGVAPNHPTSCADGVCHGTSCGLIDEAGIAAAIGQCTAL